MNAAILEVAQKIADGHALSIRDVIHRFRRAGVQFRTETTRTYDTFAHDECVLLGYSFEGFFYPYTDEDNQALLEKLVLEAKPRDVRRPEAETEPAEKPADETPAPTA